MVRVSQLLKIFCFVLLAVCILGSGIVFADDAEDEFDKKLEKLSKEGVVSLRDNALLLVANDLPDVAMDARMALAFMRLVQSEERLAQWMSCINASFRKKIAEGFYARAA